MLQREVHRQLYQTGRKHGDDYEPVGAENELRRRGMLPLMLVACGDCFMRHVPADSTQEAADAGSTVKL